MPRMPRELSKGLVVRRHTIGIGDSGKSGLPAVRWESHKRPPKGALQRDFLISDDTGTLKKGGATITNAGLNLGR